MSYSSAKSQSYGGKSPLYHLYVIGLLVFEAHVFQLFFKIGSNQSLVGNGIWRRLDDI